MRDQLYMHVAVTNLLDKCITPFACTHTCAANELKFGIVLTLVTYSLTGGLISIKVCAVGLIGNYRLTSLSHLFYEESLRLMMTPSNLLP